MSVKIKAPKVENIKRKLKMFKDLKIGESFIHNNKLYEKDSSTTAITKNVHYYDARDGFVKTKIVTKVTTFDAVMILNNGIDWNE